MNTKKRGNKVNPGRIFRIVAGPQGEEGGVVTFPAALSGPNKVTLNCR